MLSCIECRYKSYYPPKGEYYCLLHMKRVFNDEKCLAGECETKKLSEQARGSLNYQKYFEVVGRYKKTGKFDIDWNQIQIKCPDCGSITDHRRRLEGSAYHCWRCKARYPLDDERGLAGALDVIKGVRVVPRAKIIMMQGK